MLVFQINCVKICSEPILDVVRDSMAAVSCAQYCMLKVSPLHDVMLNERPDNPHWTVDSLF